MTEQPISRRLALAILLFLSAFQIACAGNIPPVAEAPAQPPAYQIAPGDKMRITVYGEESLSGEHAVTPEGEIAFPLLGNVSAAGRTIEQLHATLADKLSPDYLVNPRIRIEILNYRPIYVLGEVTRSGAFDYVPDLTATQAVALAGGYTYRADRSRVIVRRAGGAQEVTYELRSDRPVYLSPGDTVRVGERYF